MQGPGRISLVLPLWLALVACSSSPLPKLLPANTPPQPAASQTDKTDTAQAPLEKTLIVLGTPTEVYALVARGALGCWFGGEGPLKPTHVFQAEAEPPAKGGAAEIVIHERDETLRDKRGARAYRIAITSESAGVRMQISMLKLDPQLADIMSKDVEIWAKGGGSCQLRRPPAPAPQPITPVVGKGGVAPGVGTSKKR